MIGAALVIGCAGQAAFAADDEDEEKPLIDTTIMRHILQGLGWQRDQSGIEYRERSPLVLPANVGLYVWGEGELGLGDAPGGPAYMLGSHKARV